jgi:glycosyltransferase involved in cell wall biosynthesis
MSRPLRIALVAPVAVSVPPPRSGSIEVLTAHLADGLTARGQDVTLFATGDSTTRATLSPTFPRGYREDPAFWPWELCELFNLSAAVDRAAEFDVIHCQSEYYPMSLAFEPLASRPLLHCVHYIPGPAEVAMWTRYPAATFVAVSETQARRLEGMTVVATIHHGLDPDVFSFRESPDDYVLFLGRFTEGKGARQAIDIARAAGLRIRLAAQANDYYRTAIEPLVDGDRVVYAGEVSGAEKVALLGGARALVYPVQAAESFGLVLVEAMMCGTPVAALDAGAVREVVEDGVTGIVVPALEDLPAALPQAMALDRRRVRERAVARFGVARMVDAYLAVYRALAARQR